MLREAVTGTLATIDRESGHPYASLVAVATAPDGTPLLLLSTLARHTRNLLADPRVSLLVTSPPPGADPLTTPRLTVLGTMSVSPDPKAKSRYVARHPAAAGYADFGDFAIYELAVSGGHLVAGFGRIETIARSRLLSPQQPEAIATAEADLLTMLNEKHATAVRSRLQQAGVSMPSPPHVAGIDATGCDVVIGTTGRRLVFEVPATSPEHLRALLAAVFDLPDPP